VVRLFNGISRWIPAACLSRACLVSREREREKETAAKLGRMFVRASTPKEVAPATSKRRTISRWNHQGRGAVSSVVSSGISAVSHFRLFQRKQTFVPGGRWKLASTKVRMPVLLAPRRLAERKYYFYTILSYPPTSPEARARPLSLSLSFPPSRLSSSQPVSCPFLHRFTPRALSDVHWRNHRLELRALLGLRGSKGRPLCAGLVPPWPGFIETTRFYPPT